MSTLKKLPVIGPGLAGTYMTPAEFDSAEEWKEGYRYELINRVLVVSPPPSIGERGPNDLLGYLLRQYQEEHPQGSALDYTAPEQTVSTGKNRRRVDRAIWAGLGRKPDDERDIPTVAIEFVSSRRRDRRRDYRVKRREYGKAGVGQYWIVDRFRRRLTAVRYRATDAEELVIKEGEVYTTELLPGFELPVARLFAEAEGLRRAKS